MNKLTLKHLLICVIMSQTLAVAGEEDIDSFVNGLLGDYANIKQVQTTPVRTKIVRGSDVASPTFVRNVESLEDKLKQGKAELEEAKNAATELNKQIEQQKGNIQELSQQVSSLETDSAEKAKSIELLNNQIIRMQATQGVLVKRYQEVAKSSISLEAATALKMRITEEIQNIKQSFLADKPARATETEYLFYRFKVESTALKLTTSVVTKEDRTSIEGLSELYDSIFETLDKVDADRTEFELADEAKSALKGIFKSIFDKGATKNAEEQKVEASSDDEHIDLSVLEN